MQVDRRTLIARARRHCVAGPALAQRRSASGWYDRAIVIDALGGIGDPYSPEEQLRLSDRAWTEMVATGVTVVRDTVMPVGNVADPWGDYQKDIATKQNIVNANPDRLLLVRTAADILKAKREKKFAMLIGTQDTAMVGPELDRLAQMKKDGVMTVQLTYNNRNLSGDGSLEPRQCRAVEARPGDDRADRGGEAAARPQPRRREDDGRGGGACQAAAGDQPHRRAGADRSSAQHQRRDDQGGGRQGRRRRRLFHAVPDARQQAEGRRTCSRHVEHVANVAGEDHVGIGTDNGAAADAARRGGEGAASEMGARADQGRASPRRARASASIPMVADYNSVDRYRRFAADLQKRGWSEARLEKLMGGNFLRVYREAWGG